MVSIAKVSSRGQVAVPKVIREKLHIKDGDTLLLRRGWQGIHQEGQKFS